MSASKVRCVLLADAHHDLSEGVRDLLATAFEAVVMVADEFSLFETAERLQADLTILDLILAKGDGLDLVRRFRARFPNSRMIVISVYDNPTIRKLVVEAGADGFIVKHAIGSDLLPAADALLTGMPYVSPEGA